MMKKTYKILTTKIPASFTIEASVIVPVTLIIIAWFITTSLSIHSNVTSYTEAVFQIISSAPEGMSGDSSDGNSSSRLINTENLDGRKVLLKYKLLRDGVRMLSGGLEVEE